MSLTNGSRALAAWGDSFFGVEALPGMLRIFEGRRRATPTLEWRRIGVDFRII